MKLVGFIKEHNDITEAVSFESIITTEKCDNEIALRVINYLDKGILLLGWMGYFFDLKDNSLIAPDSYYTDGIFIWPSYFPYYLKKYGNYNIDKDFLEYLANINFECSRINIQNMDEMEQKLLKRLDP